MNAKLKSPNSLIIHLIQFNQIHQQIFLLPLCSLIFLLNKLLCPYFPIPQHVWSFPSLNSKLHCSSLRCFKHLSPFLIFHCVLNQEHYFNVTQQTRHSLFLLWRITLCQLILQEFKLSWVLIFRKSLLFYVQIGVSLSLHQVNTHLIRVS